MLKRCKNERFHTMWQFFSALIKVFPLSKAPSRWEAQWCWNVVWIKKKAGKHMFRAK